MLIHKNTKTSQNKIKHLVTRVLPLLIVLVFSGVLGVNTVVNADKFDDEIRKAQAQNAEGNVKKEQLGVQAQGYADAVSSLQSQISALQAKIAELSTARTNKEAEITAAEVELAQQKDLLGKSIKAMYLEGKISTIEILATSKDLSEFVDKQEYRDSVKTKISKTVDKINALRAQLKQQKIDLDLVISDQQRVAADVSTQQGEQQRLLAYTNEQKAAVENSIVANNNHIVELRTQQAAENAKRFVGTKVIAGHNGNDTYPDNWRFAAQDSQVDSWGMYNRECVSYTAWKVASTGRYMPYWGGIGNANQWDENARAAGIPVDTSPRAGDIAVAHWGYYGHVMYVESVNANGTINISQYNYDFNGTYSEAYNFSPAGLVFIHF